MGVMKIFRSHKTTNRERLHEFAGTAPSPIFDIAPGHRTNPGEAEQRIVENYVTGRHKNIQRRADEDEAKREAEFNGRSEGFFTRTVGQVGVDVLDSPAPELLRDAMIKDLAAGEVAVRGFFKRG